MKAWGDSFDWPAIAAELDSHGLRSAGPRPVVRGGWRNRRFSGGRRPAGRWTGGDPWFPGSGPARGAGNIADGLQLSLYTRSGRFLSSMAVSADKLPVTREEILLVVARSAGEERPGPLNAPSRDGGRPVLSGAAPRQNRSQAARVRGLPLSCRQPSLAVNADDGRVLAAKPKKRGDGVLIRQGAHDRRVNVGQGPGDGRTQGYRSPHHSLPRR